jgi:hypothetical protein
MLYSLSTETEYPNWMHVYFINDIHRHQLNMDFLVRYWPLVGMPVIKTTMASFSCRQISVLLCQPVSTHWITSIPDIGSLNNAGTNRLVCGYIKLGQSSDLNIGCLVVGSAAVYSVILDAASNTEDMWRPMRLGKWTESVEEGGIRDWAVLA